MESMQILLPPTIESALAADAGELDALIGVRRVLVVHNRYQHAGGEDSVVCAELGLLRAMGHDVEVLEENNDNIVQWNGAAKAAFECVYSTSSAQRVRALIEEFQPDVMHVHNFFPRISPAAHYAARAMSVPVVQTLHNYRLLCPSSMFLRDGKRCEACLGKEIPWPAVQYGCYRKSRAASAAVVGMLSVHRALGTWERTVHRFIAPSEFARSKFIEGGLPAARIAVKPHFVSPDPGAGNSAGGYALFVGRLSEEKGVQTLLEAWRRMSTRTPLKIVGDGPLASDVRDAAAAMREVGWLGARSREEVLQLMRDAAVLVVPSVSYETFGMVIAEAFAAGLPVAASCLGAMTEMVRDGETGRQFTAGDAGALAEAVQAVLMDPRRRTMSLNARRAFEERFTAAASYAQLIEIYRQAIGVRIQ